MIKNTKIIYIKNKLIGSCLSNAFFTYYQNVVLAPLGNWMSGPSFFPVDLPVNLENEC